ncbi:MAG TPA: PQQ-binding-like beta-propeller repeat protein [Verrucomicrobiae bacterium]|nr:PQQ-binding-like beta-propeller repeat protein [Verrucomicrobiae bacterium]
MKIVVDCACQTPYEFEVEPVDGQMPGQVSCPTCGADGTDYANSVIQETLANQPKAAPKIKLKGSVEEEPDGDVSEEAADEAGGLPKSCFIHKEQPVEAFCLTCKKPICLKCMKQTGYFCSIYCRNRAQQAGMDIPVYAGQDRVVREREYKRVTQMGSAILVGLVALFITYEWYVIFGQKPSVKFAMPLAADARLMHAQFANDHELLLVSADSVSDYDFKKKQALWSTSLTKYRAKQSMPTNLAALVAAAQNEDQPKSPEAIAAQKKLVEQMADYEENYYPTDTQLHVVGNDLWVTVGRSIVCLDRATGTEKLSVKTEGRVRDMTFGDDAVIVVSAKGEYDRILTRIQLPSGEQQTERRSLPQPPARRFDMNMDMEAAREPYIPDDRHEFVATGSTVVDLDVKLVEKKVVTVDTMKAADPNSKKFENLGVTQTKEFAEDVMNDMKRSRGEGIAKVDQSRYALTLQRVFGKDIAPWTGEVTGSPALFAMKTVDVLVAGNVMYAFDKSNQKLWQSNLSYPIAPQFTQREYALGYGRRTASAAPCVERGNTLYLFDRGVLTAFDAQSGAVRWRMPSVGISNIRFDDSGMLYVSTSTASPESIQYSDQVSLDKVDPVIVKVDPANGKALWRLEKAGDECYAAGKYLYSTHVIVPGGLMTMIGKGSSSRTFHLFRLNPRNGKQMWDCTREGSPGSVDFCNNEILFQFDDRLEVLKFLPL